MSSTPAPSEDTPPAARMPTAVRVAVIVMSVLAGLLLLNAALTWFGREAIADRLVEVGDISRAEAERFLVTWLIPYLVLGLALAVSAFFLPQRQPWARWLGLAATVVICLLTLFSVLAGGSASALSLLLLVLSIAGITSLMSRTTTAWVPRLRSKR